MNIFVNVGKPFRNSFFQDRTMARLKELGDVQVCQNEPLFGDQLKNALEQVDVLFTGWGQKTITYDQVKNIKLIVHTGGTVGGIIDDSVFLNHIPVISGNQYYAKSVSEGVIAYMLYAQRHLGFYESQTKKGNWLPPVNQGLIGKTIGIVSLGEISRILIKQLQLFSPKKILVYSTRRDEEFQKQYPFEYVSLDELFSSSDIISVHTARTKETLSMINKHHFDLIQNDALFINTSRGEVVNEEDLIQSLKENRFRAVLDVYTKEPLPKDSILCSLPNVYLFPHHCGPTYDLRDTITNYLIDDLESFMNNKPLKNEIPYEKMLRMTH